MDRPTGRAARILLVLALAAAAIPAGAEPPRPKRVVVFGIDGMDAQRFEDLRAAGRLPHFDAAAKRGCYARLATTNPAQSPVSWASMVTGTNPGRTSIYDFLRRDPEVPARIELSLASRTFTTKGLPAAGLRILIPLATGIAAGLVAWGLLRLGFRLAKGPGSGKGIALAAGLLAAAGGGAATHRVMRWIPAELPAASNNRLGTSLWTILGEAGIPSVVVEAPVSFPADGEKAANLSLLAGLGAPDVQGIWGFYSVFTDDAKQVVVPETLGLVDYLPFDAAGVARSRVYGPPDIALTEEEKQRIEKEAEVANTLWQQKTAVASAKRFEERVWHHADLSLKSSCVLEIRRDLAARTATIRIGSGGPKPVLDLPLPTVRTGPAACLPDPADAAVTWGAPVVVKEGAWSAYVPFEFRMNPLLKVRGLGKFWLESAGGEGREFRLILTPVSFDPTAIPPNLPFSFPAEFSVSLAAQAGLYTTLGWPCLTNPVKDDLLSDEAFVQQIRELTAERRRKLKAAMATKDWRFLFVMFSEVDRAQHALWRHVDPKSPSYDAAAAAKYGGAIDDTYVAMDGVLGEIVAAVGEEAAVIVMSDHGFAPFRRCVNLNNWLLEHGYQANRPGLGGGTGADQNVGQLFGGHRFFDRLDWENTKAYALGIGAMYVNLKGREKHGSVDPKDYDAVCAAIRKDLLDLRDADGARVVHEVYLGKDLYKGPSVAKYAPDLVVGFERGYRVSWQTTLGGGGQEVIEDNRFRWSGDHCSVDPTLVPGILVSTVPLAAGNAGVMDIAPTVLDLFGLGAKAAEMDGRSLLPR